MHLYHLIPKNLKGDLLLPLNEIKKQDEELYQNHVKKYKGREALMECNIPKLNCKWNDVIFLLPIHPLKIKKTLSDFGISWEPGDWFEIAPDQLKSMETNGVIYKTKPKEKGNFSIEEDEIFDLNVESLSEAQMITDITLAHYQRYKEGKEKYLFTFHGIPHILYKGVISVHSLKRISLSAPTPSI